MSQINVFLLYFLLILMRTCQSEEPIEDGLIPEVKNQDSYDTEEIPKRDQQTSSTAVADIATEDIPVSSRVTKNTTQSLSAEKSIVSKKSVLVEEPDGAKDVTTEGHLRNSTPQNVANLEKIVHGRSHPEIQDKPPMDALNTSTPLNMLKITANGSFEKAVPVIVSSGYINVLDEDRRRDRDRRRHHLLFHHNSQAAKNVNYENTTPLNKHTSKETTPGCKRSMQPCLKSSSSARSLRSSIHGPHHKTRPDFTIDDLSGPGPTWLSE